MLRHKSETPLAWLTLISALVHFSLETYYHVLWGQPLQALLVDYICNALMVLGAARSLSVKPQSAAGLIAAGWAYALGFGWRSLFGRLELMEAGRKATNGEPTQIVVALLLVALGVVVLMLLWSLALAWRQSRVSAVPPPA